MVRSLMVFSILAGVTFASVSVGAEEPVTPPKTVPKVVSTAVRLKLGQRTANAAAHSKGLAHHSAPLIDITQPQPNVIVVTMTGLSSVGGLPCETSMDELVFDLLQSFEVQTAVPNQRVQLTIQAQLAGMLRGNREGAGVASSCPAEAVILAGGTPVLQSVIPGRMHTGKDIELISIQTPATASIVGPGELTLAQIFTITCSHPKKCFHKNVVTAAFGNETGRTPEWMGLLDPNREIPKQRHFGFQVVIHAEPAR